MRKTKLQKLNFFLINRNQNVLKNIYIWCRSRQKGATLQHSTKLYSFTLSRSEEEEGAGGCAGRQGGGQREEGEDYHPPLLPIQFLFGYIMRVEDFVHSVL